MELTSLGKNLGNFLQKIYLNDFFCGQLIDLPTTLAINELLHMYISRILPIFSEYLFPALRGCSRK